MNLCYNRTSYFISVQQFHSTNFNDTFSDSTSLWSSEEGSSSIVYYPISACKEKESDSDVEDSEGWIKIHSQDDTYSVLSDTTSSLIRFMDEMDNESLSDVSSFTTDNEDDFDTLTTVSDMTDFTYDLLHDDKSEITLELPQTKNEDGHSESDISSVTRFLDEIIAEVALKMNAYH